MTPKLAIRLVAGVAVLATATPAVAAADGDVVRRWNDIAFEQARANSASDAQAARLYAMVGAAMYDAVNGTASGGPPREAAIVSAPAPVAADPGAAAAGAAHDVLAALYPNGTATYDAQLAADLAAAPPGVQAERGRDWGARVASGVLAAREHDGSAGNVIQAGGSGPGVFTGSWSGTQFRQLDPFVIDDSAAYFGSGPPALGSARYAEDFAEVAQLGDARVPDEAAKATWSFWNIPARTNQPPGAWLQVAQAVSRDQGLPLRDTARLFALTSLAMADTVAPTYETKHRFHFWRPATAIRSAAGDGNPATTADAGWSPRAGGIGGTPEHWSGHSAFSTAAATVLAGFFCDDAVPFTLTTDQVVAQPETRSYGSFSSAADEAGRSRVLGGLHFEFSNRAGAEAGQAIASEVLATGLLRRNGRTHHGSCPL